MLLLNLTATPKPLATRTPIWIWTLLGAFALCLIFALPAARANRTQDNPPSPPALAFETTPAPVTATPPPAPRATAHRVTPPDPTLIPKLAVPVITYAADDLAAPAN